ncbi:MAG: prolyl oligopeptidase family serine peptidase [Planctomycetes bacterium]|nr:prolyl oligopeptidase family serine peptidase [Planctomycetota bacterium]
MSIQSRRVFLRTVSLAGAAIAADTVAGKAPVAGGDKVSVIRYRSSADSTDQPTMFYAPESKTAIPLLAGLHSWSADYRQVGPRCSYAQWCIRNKWAFIGPNFRGPNKRPQACGSQLAVDDIISAVQYARKNANIDENRIYLVGASGGGHAALLMAGRAPEIWAGVSAWVGISDLKAWHAECTKSKRRYAGEIEKSCGGPPGKSDKVDIEYKNRSPLTWLHRARKTGVRLDINAGINDGHSGSVPISHSLRAFNAVADPADRISDADIVHMVEKAEVPTHLRKKLSDRTYGPKIPLLRKISGPARITIFQGGHEIVPTAALTWLSLQKKSAPKPK